MVRGELFKRYPNAIVYAGRASPDPKGQTLILDQRTSAIRCSVALRPGYDFPWIQSDGGDAWARLPNSARILLRFSAAAFRTPFRARTQRRRQPGTPTGPNSPGPTSAVADGESGSAQSRVDRNPMSNAALPSAVYRMPVFPSPPCAVPIIANSPWRVASYVFRNVLQNSVIPDFLSQPDVRGTAIVNDPITARHRPMPGA